MNSQFRTFQTALKQSIEFEAEIHDRIKDRVFSYSIEHQPAQVKLDNRKEFCSANVQHDPFGNKNLKITMISSKNK